LDASGAGLPRHFLFGATGDIRLLFVTNALSNLGEPVIVAFPVRYRLSDETAVERPYGFVARRQHGHRSAIVLAFTGTLALQLA